MQPEEPPKSTAQLFIISWLSKIRVILINLGIRTRNYHTYSILTSKAEFYPQLGGKCHIILMAFNDDCVCHGL